MDYAKANPGKITYISPGASTTPHITMERIAIQEGIKWVHVPTKGGGEPVAGLLGKHVDAIADSTEWGPQVDAGTFRLLVTWGNQRTKRWPNVPTLKELGYGIVSNSPWGIAGPKGMDSKVVKILHDAFKKGMEEPAFQQILAKYDFEPYYKNPEDYAAFVRQLCSEEKEIVEKLGLKKE
jgi:tripartite-type tricarboxylate transporter receptor subunit TctC